MVTIRIQDAQEDLTWEQWEERVAAGRIPPDALVRFEPVTGSDFFEANTLDIYTSLDDDSRRSWADRYRSGSPPWMTALVAGVQIRLWWLVFTAGAAWVVDWLQLFQPLVYEDGEVWRLITAGFTHADPGHIASNLVMLVYVGWFLERALGRINLLTIFVASVVGGSILSITMTPGTGSIGASGGVLGVVAAATVFGFVRFGLLPDRARVIFGWALLPYLVLIYALGWWSPTTDNWAHTGGLFTGALLALLLDPPELERKPRWNTLVIATTTGGIAAVLAMMWFAGPHLIQVQDIANWSDVKPERTAYRELTWTAPTTWRRARTPDGLGFASQADLRRFFVAKVQSRTRAASFEGEFESWEEDLRGKWEDSITLSERTPVTLGDRPAMHQKAILGDPPSEVRERWVSLQGVNVLTVVWSADVERHNRLIPVRDQLVGQVEWGEPARLERARDKAERRPKSRPLKRDLAEQLMLAGSAAEAQDLWQSLIDERSETADGWVGMLELERLYPGTLEDPHAFIDKALAQTGLPEVQAAAALMLAEPEPALARGLLEDAWILAPGDSHLRRARKSVGLPVTLERTLPAHLFFDPLTGARVDLPRRPAGLSAPTLAEARVTGAEVAKERESLIGRALQERGPAAIATLYLLRDGQYPNLEDLERQLTDVARDISSLEYGRDLRWLDDAEQARLSALLPLEEQTVDALKAPDAGDEDLFEPYLLRLGIAPVDGPDGPYLQRY